MASQEDGTSRQHPFLTPGTGGEARVITASAVHSHVGRSPPADSGNGAPTPGVTSLPTGQAGGFRHLHAHLDRLWNHGEVVPAQQSVEQIQVLRRRVLGLAVALGVLTVVHNLAAYIIGIAEVEAVMGDVHRIAPEAFKRYVGHMPNAGMLFVMSSPRVFFNLCLSLIVPLCGYLGAKNSDSRLLCCFCGCSFVGSWLAAAIVLFLGSTIICLQGVEPTVEAWLQQCDPTVCMNLNDATHQVDCLAGMGRELKFDNIPHLDFQCPQAFLTCPSHAPGDACVMPPPLGGPRCEDQARRSFCGTRPWEVCDFLGNCIFRNDKCLPAGLPLDPTSRCIVNKKHVEAMVLAAKLAPVLIPKVESMMQVKLALSLPAIVLGCLSFCWGLSLYNKIAAGYVHLSEPALVRTQLAQVQPGAQQQQPAAQGMQAVQGVVVAEGNTQAGSGV